MSETGKVNIHGKEYETVASRVQRFRKEHGDKYGIVTDLVSRNDDVVLVKATIVRYGEVLRDNDGAYTDQAVIATGYAEENRDSSSINRTSAIENAETSAIGRALANFGIAGTEYASADEVSQAIQQRSVPTDQSTLQDRATATQKAQITALLRGNHIKDENFAQVVQASYGYNLKTLTRTQATNLITRLKDHPPKVDDEVVAP